MPTQDELIQAELDGTIEELEAKIADEQSAEEPIQEATEEAEAESVEQKAEQPAVEKTESTTEKKDSVIKILKQRNEARAEVESLKSQLKSSSELEARIKELEESIASKELEKEALKEKESFYAQFPNAKGHEEGIEKIRTTKDLSYSEAFQLYAAQNDPTLLMDEQSRNKMTSTTTLTGVATTTSYDKNNPSIKDFDKMSDDEFLAWSDGKARADRVAAGYIK